MLKSIRRLFRNRKHNPLPKGVGIYIDGHVYERYGAGIRVTMPGPDGRNVNGICSRDHVAPNGVSIVKIGYCLALADGIAPFPSFNMNGRGNN